MLENMKFTASEGLTLTGVLVRPKENEGKLPAILILEGSGKSPAKERPENDSFQQLAIELANVGFVVYHYNKRGSGENSDNGSYLSSSFDTHIDDALAAFNNLKKLPFVNEDKIYVLGQSMGGQLATQIALRESIAGLITYSSPTRPLHEFMVDQSRLIQKYMGKSEAEINDYITLLEQDVLKMGNGSYECLEPRCALINGERVYEGAEAVSYLEGVARNDQYSNLEKVRVPTLVISGTSDFVVPVVDGELAYKALSKSNEDVTFKMINDLDHFFANNKTQEESFKYLVDAQKNQVYQKVNPNLLKVIFDWLEVRSN